MKKLFTTLLCISYFLASSGATIHVHYCGGKAVEWDLGKNSLDGKCPGCGMKEKDKKGCCHDKETTVKNSDNYQHSLFSFQTYTPVPAISTTPISEVFVAHRFTALIKFHQSDSSPQKALQLHILNCIFLI